VRRADRVIVVIEESRDFMLGYGISPDKVHVVPNYVDLDYLRACSSGAECPDGSENRVLITYIGGIGPHRGVDVAVKAMADVARRAPDALLLIIGNEGDYTDYIRRLVSKLGLERSVRLLGWQPFERVPDYLAASSVGLIPHQRNQHCDNTIPNKLFDYMAFEKPVIVSDCPPLVRITNDAQAGMVFCADRPGELAERILELRSNPELAARLGRGGAAAVQSRYNWATAAEELVKVYAILARERSPQ
jgi:glycosyltransferase involved in cell wall biosynthesis